MINIKQFYDEICLFFPKDWKEYLKSWAVEAIVNPLFIDDCTAFFIKLNSSCTASELDKCLTLLYENLANRIDSNNDAKNLDNSLTAFSYFHLLENSVEDNKYIDKLINNIKISNPKKYIEITSQIDNKFLSKKTLLESLNYKLESSGSEDLDKYMVLKKWQDITHYFYVDKVKPLFDLICTKYFNFINLENDNYTIRMNIANIRLKNHLENKLISCSNLTHFLIMGFDNTIKDVFGGKAYGLAFLNSIKVKVPTFLVVPYNFDLKKSINIKNKNIYYSVRSSANIEDGASHSYAGMFKSFLNISYQDLPVYIQKVRDSACDNKINYFKNNQDIDIKMSVIIQEFIEPEISGVWFGTRRQRGILEYTSGNGEKLVSGKITPTRIFYKKSIIHKTNEISKIGIQLVEAQKIVLQKHNNLPDFEWCVINNELNFLQYRPITTMIKVNQSITKQSKKLSGIGCSSGKLTAMCQTVHDLNNSVKFLDNKILATKYTDPDWVPLIKKSKGVITEIGGFLCHTAIICRELNIPCIVGLGTGETSKLDNKLLKIDAKKGTIKIIKNKK